MKTPIHRCCGRVYLFRNHLVANGSFKKAITKQISQAKGAMFSLIAKAQRLNLPIDIVIELFDQLVLPILL